MIWGPLAVGYKGVFISGSYKVQLGFAQASSSQREDLVTIMARNLNAIDPCRHTIGAPIYLLQPPKPLTATIL